MNVAEPDDPEGVITTAANTARAIGIAFLVLAAITGCAFAVLYGRATAAGLPAFVLLLAVGFYLVPGVVYLVLAGQLARHRKWAAIALVVVASLTTLASAALLAVTVWGARDADDSPNCLSLMILLFFLALSVLLIVSAARSIRVVDLLLVADADRTGRPLGFAPVMPNAPPHPRSVRPTPVELPPIPLAGEDDDDAAAGPPTRPR